MNKCFCKNKTSTKPKNNNHNTNPNNENIRNDLSSINNQMLTSKDELNQIDNGKLPNKHNESNQTGEDATYDDLKSINKTLEDTVKKLENENQALKDENQVLKNEKQALKNENQVLKNDKNNLITRNNFLEKQLNNLNKNNLNMNVCGGINNNIGNIIQNPPLQNNLNFKGIQENKNNNINIKKYIQFSFQNGEVIKIPITNSIKLNDIFKYLIHYIGDKYDENKINLFYNATLITEHFKGDKKIDNFEFDLKNPILVVLN